jgi:hypothetical protein
MCDRGQRASATHVGRTTTTISTQAGCLRVPEHSRDAAKDIITVRARARTGLPQSHAPRSGSQSLAGARPGRASAKSDPGRRWAAVRGARAHAQSALC